MDGFNLGGWVQNQRTKQDSLSLERKKRLNALSFVWNTHDLAWEVGVRNLLKFKKAEGHCRVPHGYKLNGSDLGSWVLNQRHNKDSLPENRRQQLDDLGFVWDPLAARWEEGFAKLERYSEINGHCRVPQAFKLDGFNLGAWVFNQRKTKESMSFERRKRLDDLGFVWGPKKDPS